MIEHVDEMLECIRNWEKQAEKKSHGCSSHGTPTKRQRLTSPRDELLRRYPARVLDTIDDTPRFLKDIVKRKVKNKAILSSVTVTPNRVRNTG